MSEVTNHLVEQVKAAGRKPLSVSAGVVLTTALAVSILFHENMGRAADPVPPINDNSIAALTDLDRAVESVAAHVQPAVVNVQVTSRGSEEDQASQDGGQQQQDLQQYVQFSHFHLLHRNPVFSDDSRLKALAAFDVANRDRIAGPAGSFGAHF